MLTSLEARRKKTFGDVAAGSLVIDQEQKEKKTKVSISLRLWVTGGGVEGELDITAAMDITTVNSRPFLMELQH